MVDDELLALARDVDRLCRLSGEFELRSGGTATEYFDKYLFEGDPALLRRVADRIVRLVPTDTEVLGGLELGGVPLATLLGSITGLPVVFVRKQAKSYGTKKLVEGTATVGRTVLLVEDVITTGGAVLAAATAVRSSGATVHSVVCAIDRTSANSSALAAEGIHLRSVMTKALLDRSTNTQTSR
jgi:orotate phosphoribosyltransferase